MNEDVIYLSQFGESSRCESFLLQVLDKNKGMGEKVYLILDDMPIPAGCFHHFFDILSEIANK